MCVCVWIQATLGTQRTACKSLLSFHHVGFRGQTQVIGLGSMDAYPLVYCVCFFILLHVSSWCIPSVPLLLTEMIHSFKRILLSFSSQSIRPQPLALPFFLCAHLPKYVLGLEIDTLHYGRTILYDQESLPDARIVHTGQQPEITHLVTQAEYSLIVSFLTISFLQPLQLTSGPFLPVLCDAALELYYHYIILDNVSKRIFLPLLNTTC